MNQDRDREFVANVIAELGERILFGKWVDSFNIDHLSWLTAGVTSSAYADQHMSRVPRFDTKYTILDHCLAVAPPEGLILEFGVFSGDTITRIGQNRVAQKIYGFDSFEGLPEDWRPGYEKGQFSIASLPHVPTNVELIKGWFNLTLPLFVAQHQGERLSLLHVDCDLYSSTQTIFLELRSMIRPNTIILFDEFFNYPGWQKHEALAFEEYCHANSVSYEFIGVVPHHQQVAVRILG